MCVKLYTLNENVGLLEMNMIEDEAQILKKLDHENIVKFYDVEKDSKSIALIMELVEGISLYKLIKI